MGDARLTREIFVSYPDLVMVVRLAADKPGRVSVRTRFQSPYLDRVVPGPDTLTMDGSWKGPIPVRNPLIAPVEGHGLRFQARLRAIPSGGRLSSGEDGLRIEGADAVTFLVTAATSHVNYRDITADASAACEKTLSRLADADYASMRRRHEDDVRALGEGDEIGNLFGLKSSHHDSVRVRAQGLRKFSAKDCYVALPIAGKDQNRVVPRRNEDLVVNRIHFQVLGGV